MTPVGVAVIRTGIPVAGQCDSTCATCSSATGYMRASRAHQVYSSFPLTLKECGVRISDNPQATTSPLSSYTISAKEAQRRLDIGEGSAKSVRY